MREILFKGKMIANGSWSEGNLLVTKQGCCITPDATVLGSYGAVDPETVGQYTGLKDENGQKIFEGDILEVDVFKNLHRYKAVWTVEYKERFSQGNGYYFYGKNRRFNTRATQSIIINTHATVIGNIYDNPELLGDEENDSNDT